MHTEYSLPMNFVLAQKCAQQKSKEFSFRFVQGHPNFEIDLYKLEDRALENGLALAERSPKSKHAFTCEWEPPLQARSNWALSLRWFCIVIISRSLYFCAEWCNVQNNCYVSDVIASQQTKIEIVASSLFDVLYSMKFWIAFIAAPLLSNSSLRLVDFCFKQKQTWHKT